MKDAVIRCFVLTHTPLHAKLYATTSIIVPGGLFWVFSLQISKGIAGVMAMHME